MPCVPAAAIATSPRYTASAPGVSSTTSVLVNSPSWATGPWTHWTQTFPRTQAPTLLDDLPIDAPRAIASELLRALRDVQLLVPADGVYRGDVAIAAAGTHGISARVFPVHPDLANRLDMGRIAWAE